MRAQPCAGGGATARNKSEVLLYNFRSITMIKQMDVALPYIKFFAAQQTTPGTSVAT